MADELDKVTNLLASLAIRVYVVLVCALITKLIFTDGKFVIVLLL